MSNSAERILFVLTSHGELGDTGNDTGYYLSEVSHPYKVLSEAGFHIDFASPEGGPAPMDPESHDLDDKVNASFLSDDDVKEALENTIPAREVNPADYDAIYFAGGHGTMWDLPDNKTLAKLTSSIYESGGVVGAVCHGPAGLVNVKLSDGSYLVSGKQMSCFTDEEERTAELEGVVPFLLESKLRERGATIEKAEPFEEAVTTDGRLVTGQNPASATGVGEALAQVLTAKASA